MPLSRRSIGFGAGIVGLLLVPGASQLWAQSEPSLELGREVFVELAQPTCATCHTLADAGAEGTFGPNLDRLMPTAERIAAAVANGFDAMPGFGDVLTPEQIEAVAHYVATVAGQPTEAELELGRQVFVELAQPTCATCHTLADAGAEGTFGPNLDRLMPTATRIAAAVANGFDAMPGFGDVLTAEEIDAVARYVATVAGQTGTP